jgi:hypothetical protein
VFPGWKGDEDMRRMAAIGALAVALAVSAGGMAAIEVDLTRAEVERALKLARGTEAQRAQFHAPYRIPTADAFVERLEVITEFRRAVLIAEERVAAGEWAFGISPRSVEDALKPWRRKISIRTHIRFHPQNVYPMTPQIEISVGVGRDQLVPLRTHTDPQYAAATRGAGTAPLVGAVAETDFDAGTATPRTLDVSVRVQGGTELHRLVDFGTMK